MELQNYWQDHLLNKTKYIDINLRCDYIIRQTE